MSEALTRETAITAQAAVAMLVKAATYGQPRDKACRALARLARCADRAADDCRDFANVYPLRGGPVSRTARAHDDARDARLKLAVLLAQAARTEIFNLRVGQS